MQALQELVGMVKRKENMANKLRKNCTSKNMKTTTSQKRIQWEYKRTVGYFPDYDRLGIEGWELVLSEDFDHVHIFKRPIQKGKK